ncbi:MAG: GHMP kinase [Candidatus Bathyarchaeota archaeon]|jgi:pantoate kinase|nr:GHMP kinase [Candidatus Bathyarchaeota archaeon A05DMB-5]MDH7558303.1 GHMP kinase [Candidatus Bathyarchaeota archaeon]
MVKSAEAFSPAGISSFFEICDCEKNGNPISDVEKIGARGGGFGIQKGVTTYVDVSEAERNNVQVFINEKIAPEAETTKTVAKALLDKVDHTYNVVVKHKVEIPIGAGFGSSAAGALTTALALSKALGLNLTYNQLGRIAHVAEVKCKTGLGTVGPLMLGGCIITLEPGAPGIAVIDRIPISTDYVVVAGIFGPIPTKEVLSSQEKRLAVNKWGRKTLEKILAEPSLENFLACCREFAEKTGFVTERVRTLMKLADKADAIGAAQNMVGEAVHALTTSENVDRVVQTFKQVLPEQKILVSQVDIQGARLLR